jgi:quercetin dioxygenase-like cupin family protein
MKRRILLVVALAAVIGAVSAGLSLATPGSVTVSTEFARRTVQGFTTSMNTGDVVVSEVSYGPLGYSGWHSHPGRVIGAVQRGAITLYRGNDPTCTGRTFTAGQVFFERPGVVYYARNESTTTSTVENVTYFNVPVGGSPRIDQPDPGNCPF